MIEGQPIKIEAIKSLPNFFEVGDKGEIVPILYDEDTLLHPEIYGLYDQDGKLIRFYEGGKIPKGMEKRVAIPANYAPKGSYKGTFIRLGDGREYPGSIVTNYETYFKKI